MEPLGPRACAPERRLGSALLQALAVMFLCTAVSDPSWLHVQDGNRSTVYGVSEILHRGLNWTARDTDYPLHTNWLIFLLLMAICCYLSILIGFVAFFLDFLDTRKCGKIVVKLSSILHITTVLTSAGALMLCSYLYILLIQEIKSQAAETTKDSVWFGESFIFAIVACVMSFGAATLSVIHAIKYSRCPPRGEPQRDITEPLLSESVDPAIQGEYG
ncbi:hypothetical protein GDO86_000066 [Hymenochirus boettgeri]|uniref:Transmembrane protein 127 n=1 Tax=Hymenochirus boettgeri TaxID=247094 RepID=A0A8T2KFY2_9PIPI|nr:hypothetical protein GDO86_000066 [Hymenochirus boettgeri]